MTKNPDYTGNDGSHKLFATRCRICGVQLMHPHDVVKESCLKCRENYKRKYY